MMKITVFIYYLIILCLTVNRTAYADSGLSGQLETQQTILNQLKQLSLKELGEVQVYNPEGTLTARKSQKLLETPAALFVLTQADLQRAGVTHIAEALRLVPGIQVARAYANRWAISARGLSGSSSSKLLVMLDGRTLYNPKDATVDWDTQSNILLEDIERIEVIRGPGASLWGSNAVNGIINIVTKTAQQTQGRLITLHLGQGEEQAILGLRQGGQIADKGHYRVYGKFYQHDTFVNAQGQDQQDNWQTKQGGFRADIALTQKDHMTIQGDIYDGFTKQVLLVPLGTLPYLDNHYIHLSGFNLLGRWQHDLDQGDIIVQAYYDWSHRNQVLFLNEKRGTFDLDLQHRWLLNAHQEMIWGLGFRQVQDDFIENSPVITLTPDQRQDTTLSAFGQLEWTLQPERLTLTLGSKFEYNDYAGFEYQPTARLFWIPYTKHSFWGALSRAVRTASRYDRDFETHVALFDPRLGTAVRLNVVGNVDFQSEVLTAHELGYRFTPNSDFLWDVSLFYNQYDKLRTTELVSFDPFPPTLSAQYSNKMEGEVYGLEMAAHWQVNQNWRLVATYSYAQVQLHLQSTSRALGGEIEEGDTPHHQATIRSLFSLSPHWDFDQILYYVDNVPNQNAPHYTRFDIRLGWHPRPTLTLSTGVKNVFDNQHIEFGRFAQGNVEIADEVRRAFYIQLDYRF